MAEKMGEGKRPSERPEWGKAFLSVLTEQGKRALEEALDIYCPYTTEELEADPALSLELGEKARPLIDRALEDITAQILKVHAKNRLLQKDPIKILMDLDMALVEKYPEVSEVKKYGEAFIFNELREKIIAYFLTIVVTSEARHRALTREGKRIKVDIPGRGRGFLTQEEKVHDAFFTLIDKRSQVVDMLLRQGASLHSVQRAELIYCQYICLRDFWIPLLREKRGTFKNPDNKKRDELRDENDRLAQALFKEGNKAVPMCTVENPTLMGEKNPLIMQFAPMKEEAGMFYAACAQVDYFDIPHGERVAQDRQLQDLLQVQKAEGKLGQMAPLNVVAHMGNYPAIFVRRFNGEIQGVNIGPQALRLIAGESPRYELLRKDVLFYLAQLTCDRGTLCKMFGKTFEKKTRRPKSAQPQSTQEEQSDSEEISPNDSTEITRFYPTGETSEDAAKRAEAIFNELNNPEENDDEVGAETQPEEPDVVESTREAVLETRERVQRETEVTGHRRLLPLIGRQGKNGEMIYTSPRPSKNAIDNAAKAGKALRQGMEFTDSGEVFHPKDVPELLKAFGVQTLEEIAEAFPGRAVIRNETWIDPFKRGNPERGVIETVRAKIETTTTPKED